MQLLQQQSRLDQNLQLKTAEQGNSAAFFKVICRGVTGGDLEFTDDPSFNCVQLSNIGKKFM